MEERDFSKAREEMRRKEEQSQGAILEMLKKLDQKTRAVEAEHPASLSPRTEEAEKHQSRPRRREDSQGDGEVRRNRRMGKFVEHLSTETDSLQTEVDVSKEDKADWRLSRTGPRILSYESAPWEEESAPRERDFSQGSEDDKKEWRLSSMGPKVLVCEPAPWEDPAPIAPIAPIVREPSQGLEDILEAEEDGAESPATHYIIPKDMRSKILTPPTEYTNPSSPAGYFPTYKFPSDAIPAPNTPHSPRPSVSPTVAEFAIPKTPPKSPSNLRTRTGFKKIFLSSLRPRKRDENEPLSPSPSSSISSTATTPSLPTPTIRITSPFHPRRLDGSPIDEVPMGDTSPGEMGYKLPELRLSRSDWSEWETGYRLPELRLSRADWGEWGRQVADRL
jgi:hypothetical protein